VSNPSEDQIKLINDKLSSNSIMKKTFKGIKYHGDNSIEIKTIIDANRIELIQSTFKGGHALYYNFCNENNLLTKSGKSCRLRGYSIDMVKKGKSVAFMRNTSGFVFQDSKYFDYIPFAFSKTREAFFVNNNFTVDQLIKSNKNDLGSDDKCARSQLFLKVKKSSAYIDYDVEVIKKERATKDATGYFETIFINKKAIKIFNKIDELSLKAMTNACNIKRSDKGQDKWLEIEQIVVDSVLNNRKLDDLIDQLLKGYNNHNFLIMHLIKINQLIYKEDTTVTNKQKGAYASAMEVKKVLGGKSNKIRAYEQRLISSITLKDYKKVQEILLHLSAFTQVQMSFLIDLFEDFESNKNLAYTFINVLGEKKRKEKN